MCPAAITALLFDENLKRAFSKGGKGDRRMEGGSSNGWSKVLLEKLEPAVPISYRSRMKSRPPRSPLLSSLQFVKDSTRMGL